MNVSMAVRLGVAIAGFALVGALAGAQMPGGGMGERPGFGDHRPPFEKALGPQGNHGRWWNDTAMVEKLKLTEEQRKAMDGILLAHREKLVDLRGNVEKAELEMEPLMKDDQPNEGKILAQIDRVAQARAELEKANARFLLAIRGKLTPEQWKQLQAERGSRREERREMGPGGRGPEMRGPRMRRPDAQGGKDQTPPPAPPPGPQGSLGDGLDGDGPQAPAVGAVL